MKRFVILMGIILISPVLKGQVSSIDINSFGKKVNERRDQNIGVNPKSPDFLRLEISDSAMSGALISYNGVNAVSKKLMQLAYPKDDLRLVAGLFTTIGLDKAVFDKFVFEVFKATEAEKDRTVDLIAALTGDETLANRIYSNYSIEYSSRLSQIRDSGSSHKQNFVEAKRAFDIPVRDYGKSKPGFKHKNISTMTFVAMGAQFKRANGERGFDQTNFEIYISGSKVTLKSLYLDGAMVEEFIIDSISYDSENQQEVFYLKDAQKVQRNSFLSPAKVEYLLTVYWEEGTGYTIEQRTINNEEHRIFANQVAVKQ